MLYLETSALLSAIFVEKEAAQVEKELKEAKLIVSSRLLKVEAERALHRLSQQNPNALEKVLAFHQELKNFLARIHLHEITKEICDSAGKVHSESPLRSLDAIHLATYFKLKTHEPTLRMLSFDSHILSALGFPQRSAR